MSVQSDLRERVKIFAGGCNSQENIEKLAGEIDTWLEMNPAIKIIDRKQTSSDYFLIITVWYSNF